MLLNRRGRISAFILMVLVLAAIKETISAKTGCDSPLGMQSGGIRDFQISSTSSKSPMLSASAARLHNTVDMPNTFGAWCADITDTNQYLQIDLLTTVNLSAVASQGFDFAGGQWVSRYTLSYSCDGRTWARYSTSAEHVHQFTANNDSATVVKNILTRPILARKVRIEPKSWAEYGAICMRVELYGCDKQTDVCHLIFPTPSLGTQAPPPSTGGVTLTLPTVPPRVASTEPTTFTPKPCKGALGMQSGEIRDWQITASSFKNVWFLPSSGRLHNQYSSLTFGAWCAQDRDLYQYLQIDFVTQVNLVAIATQGMGFVDGNWVESYMLSYSCEDDTWYSYEVDGRTKVFKANSDSDSVMREDLPYYVVARRVRIHPLSWNAIGSICMRIELFGCNTTKECTANGRTSTTRPQQPITLPATDANWPITDQPVNGTSEEEKSTSNRKKITIIYIEEKRPDSGTVLLGPRKFLSAICLLLALAASIS
ncbi:venom prothrombin activator omicarin-C non-catalytic subunit isoform X2 [Nematostella vectensis]|uniref:venom prothrombin activator omicarin-C non-catalytic subunit isoform X2 n=1 Tax=Nematostella vectensis TaxID=45351 RepID=UPI0020775EEE|nr:venom prothrombin activator omicarin-C non-catalytic subunit isoform X2 [Nematostella vectensis]